MKSKKLTNNLVMLAMLILPFSVLADVMPPPSMTTKDEGILFYEGIRIFERFLETASSPRFGLTWIDVTVVAIGSAILLFLVARLLMVLELSLWKLLLLWLFPLCACLIGILWVAGFAYDYREQLVLFCGPLIVSEFAVVVFSLISKDTPRWLWRYCSLVLFILLLPLIEVSAGEYLPGLADARKRRRAWLEDHCYKCGSGLVGPYRWKCCPNCDPSLAGRERSKKRATRFMQLGSGVVEAQ